MAQNRELSVSEWLDVCTSGAYLTVRIPLSGHSMWPLVRRTRDLVTVAPLRRPVVPGDIVLFQRRDGAFVVHRVYQITGDSVTTLGDACPFPDAPISPDAICGLITHVERNGRTFQVDNACWRFIGRLWMAGRPLRCALHWIKRRLFHG